MVQRWCLWWQQRYEIEPPPKTMLKENTCQTWSPTQKRKMVSWWSYMEEWIGEFYFMKANKDCWRRIKKAPIFAWLVKRQHNTLITYNRQGFSRIFLRVIQECDFFLLCFFLLLLNFKYLSLCLKTEEKKQ